MDSMLATEKVVKEYVDTFIKFHRPILRPEYNYEVKAFVSKQQGSLVWFQFVTCDGGFSFSFLDEPISDKLAEIPQRGFAISKGSGVVFRGTNIVREEDKLIIIKGSNGPEAWSKDEARRDAQNEVNSILSQLHKMRGGTK
jgi:hypothetical protein